MEDKKMTIKELREIFSTPQKLLERANRNAFKNHYTGYVPTEGVILDDTLCTEQTGYRTTKEIVESMVLAGKRLEDYRHGRLDMTAYEDDYDGDDQDPIDVYEKDPVEIEREIVARIRYKEDVLNAMKQNVEETETHKNEVEKSEKEQVSEEGSKERMESV